jgi:hypothetical protein
MLHESGGVRWQQETTRFSTVSEWLTWAARKRTYGKRWPDARGVQGFSDARQHDRYGGGHHRWRSFRESCDHKHVKDVNLLPETIHIIITGVIICHNDRI